MASKVKTCTRCGKQFMCDESWVEACKDRDSCVCDDCEPSRATASRLCHTKYVLKRTCKKCHRIFYCTGYCMAEWIFESDNLCFCPTCYKQQSGFRQEMFEQCWGGLEREVTHVVEEPKPRPKISLEEIEALEKELLT